MGLVCEGAEAEVHASHPTEEHARQKMVMETRPTSTEDAVARTWEAFRAADPTAQYMAQARQQVAMQAMTTPPQPQQMELDAVRHAPNRQ